MVCGWLLKNLVSKISLRVAVPFHSLLQIKVCEWDHPTKPSWTLQKIWSQKRNNSQLLLFSYWPVCWLSWGHAFWSRPGSYSKFTVQFTLLMWANTTFLLFFLPEKIPSLPSFLLSLSSCLCSGEEENVYCGYPGKLDHTTYENHRQNHTDTVFPGSTWVSPKYVLLTEISRLV